MKTIVIWKLPAVSNNNLSGSGIATRGGIYEGPSRYRDYKAYGPDSYGPLAYTEDAVFLSAGQQGLQLTALVFLNHDLVTDCPSAYTQW